MATLEEIIDQARKLRPDELLRLRAALDTIEPNGESLPLDTGADDSSGDAKLRVIRKSRLDWLKSHREEFGGQYVALDGDKLIGVGPDYRSAHQQALWAGKPKAFITYLNKIDEVVVQEANDGHFGTGDQ